MYKTILFDFDGTVFDTVEGITKSAKYALNKFGMDAELDELRCFAGPPLVETFKNCFNVEQELAEQLGDAFRERYIPIGMYEAKPFDGIVDMIKALQAQGKTVAVTTMKPLFMAKSILERAGLSQLFDAVYGSPDTGVEDPKEKIIGAAIEGLGLNADETILVGDTKYDMIGAHLAGIKALGVRYGYAAPGELEQAGADYIVETVDELGKFLMRP